MEGVASIAVEALNTLGGEGKELSGSSLLAELKADVRVAELLEGLETAPGVLAVREEEDSQEETLQAQLAKALARVDSLVRALGEEEEETTRTKAFLRQSLSFFTEISRSDNQDAALSEGLDGFRRLLREDATLERLQDAFRDLKNALLTESGPAVEKKREEKGSLLGRWLKREKAETAQQASADDPYAAFRKLYHDIVDELRMVLGQVYQKKLAEIGKRLEKADSLENFSGLRKEILSVLQEYLSGVGSQREQAAAFIREVSQRILEVESILSDSLALARKKDEVESGFDCVLAEQIEGIDAGVNISKTLEELRDVVVTRLSTLKEAIEKKNEMENRLKKASEQQIGRLRKDFGKLKKELVERSEREKLLERELMTDPLTGAANRRAYDGRLSDEMERFKRYHTPFSALVLDVDHFKKVNDRYGHAVGDRCLQEIIKRVRPLLRKCDLLSRYGGEEFTVILPETESAGAKDVAEKLRKTVEKIEFLHKGEQVKITISIGVTQVKVSDEHGETLFVRMDSALYDAKNSGRNRVVVRT